MPEKIAAVVSEIAKRDWPQRWPEFMDCLQRLEAMGATQFSYVNKRSGKTATMPYWIFSAEALDDQAVLEDLATKALAIARRAKT